MTLGATGYAWLVGLHGHAAVLGLAVLLHPVVTLRTRRKVTPNAQLSADLGRCWRCPGRSGGGCTRCTGRR
ncbi:MAG: hypothetical protein R3F59_14410 [Myxococcota bacterium]